MTNQVSLMIRRDEQNLILTLTLLAAPRLAALPPHLSFPSEKCVLLVHSAPKRQEQSLSTASTQQQVQRTPRSVRTNMECCNGRAADAGLHHNHSSPLQPYRSCSTPSENPPLKTQLCMGFQSMATRQSLGFQEVTSKNSYSLHSATNQDNHYIYVNI